MIKKSIKETVKNAHIINDKLNIFELILESDGFGIPYVLSNNISTSNIKTTGSTKILENYFPIYDATIYKKLKKQGFVLVGKTKTPELGLTTNNHSSVLAVTNNVVPFSISATNDASLRSYNKAIVFKPSFGSISRHGLFVTSSFNSVEIQANSVSTCAHLTDILKGKDNYDMFVQDDATNYLLEIDKLTENKLFKNKLFYFKTNNKEFNDLIKKLTNIGFIIEEIDFDSKLVEMISTIHKIILMVEASSSSANLTGIPFGKRGKGNSIEDIIIDSRTNGLSEILKRNLVIGNYFLQKDNKETYLKAQKIRSLVVQEMNKLFKKYACFISPVNNVQTEELLIANLGGYPSITLPFKNIGLNITSSLFNDCKLLQIAYIIDSLGVDINV